MIYNDNNSTSKVFYSGFTITSVYACGGELVWSSSPYAFKAMYTLNNGTTGQVSCNSSSVLRSSDYDSYETYHNIKDLVIGECVDNLNGHIYDSVRTVDMSHSNLTVLDDDFMGSSYLRDVTFANGITTIGASCFENCSSLSSITIPSSVTTIGMMAFRQAGLVEATVHSGITYSYYVFQRCPLTSVTIEEGVSEIPNGMFAGCSALTEVTIPSTVQYIGEYGFSNTYAITGITCLATTPPNLGSDAFYGYIEYPIYVPCSAMAAYLAHSDWQPYIDRLRPIENQCESIQYRWQPSGTTCVGVDKYNNNIKQISYNSGTTWTNVSPSEYSASTLIERNSTDCGYIEPQYRTISTAVTCSGVDKYKVDEHQESLDGGVTWTTTSTTIGDLVQANSYDCGYRTRTLTTATTCSGVDKYRLEEYQVSTDSGTTWTTTGTSATTLIEANSYDCGYRTRTTSGTPYCVDVDKYQDVYSEYSTDSGTTWITASTTPTLIEHNSEDCGYVPPIEPQYRTLTTATTCVGYDKHVLEEHQESLDGGVTWTTTATTTGSLIEADSEDCGYVPPTPTGTKFTITKYNGNTVDISKQCDGSSELTNREFSRDILPSPYYSNYINVIEVGDCVTSLENNLFNSSYLEEITLPSTITSIGNNCFYNCPNLTSVTIAATTPPTLGSGAFTSSNNVTIYVPCESLAAYKTAWSAYESRITCVPSTNFKISANYIGGTNAVADCNTSTTLTFSEIRNLGEGYTAMTSAVVGDCVTTVDSYAFNGDDFRRCKNLTSITFSDSVTSIGQRAFTGNGLREVSCGSGITSIGEYAFAGNYNLSAITIPNVTTIEEGAFQSCSGVTSLVLPNTLTTIGKNCFYNCKSLTNVHLSNNLTTIGSDSFAGNTSLTSINIPNSVETIGMGAFAGCHAMTALTIGSGITSIGDSAFNACSGLTSITINATVPPTIGVFTFNNTNNAPIYVPDASVSAYKAATNWSDLADRILAIP